MLSLQWQLTSWLPCQLASQTPGASYQEDIVILSMACLLSFLPPKALDPQNWSANSGVLCFRGRKTTHFVSCLLPLAGYDGLIASLGAEDRLAGRPKTDRTARALPQIGHGPLASGPPYLKKQKYAWGIPAVSLDLVVNLNITMTGVPAVTCPQVHSSERQAAPKA